MKRQDYISWDEYFMGVDMLAAMRSKDPGTQVGAFAAETGGQVGDEDGEHLTGHGHGGAEHLHQSARGNGFPGDDERGDQGHPCAVRRMVVHNSPGRSRDENLQGAGGGS